MQLNIQFGGQENASARMDIKREALWLVFEFLTSFGVRLEDRFLFDYYHNARRSQRTPKKKNDEYDRQKLQHTSWLFQGFGETFRISWWSIFPKMQALVPPDASATSLGVWYVYVYFYSSFYVGRSVETVHSNILFVLPYHTDAQNERRKLVKTQPCKSVPLR